MMFAAYITVVFIVIKIVDSKYITKKPLNTKELVKSSAYVLASVVLGNVVNDKLNPIIEKKNIEVFTSDPAF